MNVWYEVLRDADAEYLGQLNRDVERLVADNVAKSRIIQADDVLTISAEYIKSSNKTRLPMADDFVDRIKAKGQMKPNILGFKHIESGKYLSAQDFGYLPDKSGFAPVYEHFCKLDDSTVISYASNQVSVKVTKLSHFTESRYNSLIQALIDAEADGLIQHRARKPKTSKRLYNSMRQIVLSRFKISRYEWGYLFNPTISAALIPYLSKIAQRTEQGTHYLYESPRSDCKVKIYNVTAAADRPNQTPSYVPGDRLKFEITYKTEFFARKDGLHINRLTYQNIIASLLLADNKKRLEKHLIDKLPTTGKAALWRAAGVSGKVEFMTMIDDEHSTQVSTDERISDLNARMSAIEKLTQAIATKQAEQDEINARHEAEIEALKAAVLAQSAVPDKRKLRVVGS